LLLWVTYLLVFLMMCGGGGVLCIFNLVPIKPWKLADDFSFAVKARRNTYGSYQSLPWGTSHVILPVGGTSRGELHGSYKKSLPCGVPQELFCMAKIRYCRGAGMIFPGLALL
jgi:hypothetical protein